MAAIALDPMEFMQQLEASGMPREQAEAVVRGYTATLVHNFDALVTKDYLDTRFAEFETRMDLRFAEADGKLKDLESNIDLKFASMETRFARMNVMTEEKLGEQFEISHTPALMIYRDGLLLLRKPGDFSEEALQDMVQQAEALDMDAVRADIEASPG